MANVSALSTVLFVLKDVQCQLILCSIGTGCCVISGLVGVCQSAKMCHILGTMAYSLADSHTVMYAWFPFEDIA